MDSDQAAYQSGVIPEGRRESLLAALRNNTDFSWLITPPHPEEKFLQGDVLRDFPVCLIDPEGNPRCKKIPVLVLNNTCDLQPGRSRFVTVAPVFDFEAFVNSVIAKRGKQSAEDYLNDIRANKVYEVLWLPRFAQFTQGAVVFFDQMSSAANRIYGQAIADAKRLASFSQNGFYYLLIKFTNHIARAESADVQRTV